MTTGAVAPRPEVDWSTSVAQRGRLPIYGHPPGPFPSLSSRRDTRRAPATDCTITPIWQAALAPLLVDLGIGGRGTVHFFRRRQLPLLPPNPETTPTTQLWDLTGPAVQRLCHFSALAAAVVVRCDLPHSRPRDTPRRIRQFPLERMFSLRGRWGGWGVLCRGWDTRTPSRLPAYCFRACTGSRVCKPRSVPPPASAE